MATITGRMARGFSTRTAPGAARRLPSRLAAEGGGRRPMTAKIVKDATLKVGKGGAHFLPTTPQHTFNAALLAFIPN